MRRALTAMAALGAGLVLAACSSGSPHPLPSSQPPPAVQRTVAAGTAVSFGRAEVASASPVHPAATPAAMPGMDMPGTDMPATAKPTRTPTPVFNSSVPNGRGPSAVPVPQADGCNHDYGPIKECIPLRAAGGGPLTCAYLKSYGYLPLLIYRDSAHLAAEPGSQIFTSNSLTYLVGCGP